MLFYSCVHTSLNILFIYLIFFLLFFLFLFGSSRALSQFLLPSTLTDLQTHKPTSPSLPSHHRPTSSIAHLPPFVDLTSPSCHKPTSPTPTQAPSHHCHPSLFCVWIFLCVFIWVWWLWGWWWLIFAMVVVVDDFGSEFVDFGCGGGG